MLAATSQPSLDGQDRAGCLPEVIDPDQCDGPCARQPCRAQGVSGAVAHGETQFRAQAPTGFGARAAPPDDPFPCSESEFLIQLGDRVRDTRMLRKMSRRELARRSGISERYIAQIEAGKGNVSIVLLLRIAQAIRLEQGDAG
jgi:DNA-binding XRE family transcriptional regulator